MSYKHAHRNTHADIRDRFSLFPLSFSFFPPCCSPAEGGPIEEGCGAGIHFISSKWNKSHFSLSPRLSFSLSLSAPSYFSSQVSHSISHSHFLAFSNLLCVYSYSYFLLTLPSFPLSVCGTGNSPSIAPLANKMTHWFLITSALSYSSSIILLVSTT